MNDEAPKLFYEQMGLLDNKRSELSNAEKKRVSL